MWYHAFQMNCFGNIVQSVISFCACFCSSPVKVKQVIIWSLLIITIQHFNLCDLVLRSTCISSNVDCACWIGWIWRWTVVNACYSCSWVVADLPVFMLFRMSFFPSNVTEIWWSNNQEIRGIWPGWHSCNVVCLSAVLLTLNHLFGQCHKTFISCVKKLLWGAMEGYAGDIRATPVVTTVWFLQELTFQFCEGQCRLLMPPIESIYICIMNLQRPPIIERQLTKVLCHLKYLKHKHKLKPCKFS